MMDARIRELIGSFVRHQPGASAADIERLERVLRMRLPEDYVEILQEANGAEGWVNDNRFLSLYPIDDVIGAYESFRGSGMPAWLEVFGTDGNGTAYCFDGRSHPIPILEASFPGLASDPMYVRGRSFLEFLEYLAAR